MSNLTSGDTIRAILPFRIGVGRGPNRDGLCAVGDEFEVLDITGDEVMIYSEESAAIFVDIYEEGELWERIAPLTSDLPSDTI